MRREPWRRAVENGDVRRVEELLSDAQAFPSYARADALEIAVSRGQSDVVEVLLDAAPSDPERPHKLLSLLRLAGNRGDRDVMWRLFKRLWRQPDAESGSVDETALRSQCSKMLTAARTGDMATIRAMLQEHALYAHCMDDATSETAFSTAFACGRRIVCELLLERGAFPVGLCATAESEITTTTTPKTAPTTAWSSLVRRAVEEHNVPLVDWLLTIGANAFTPAVDYVQSAFSLAAFHGATEMIQTFLNHNVRLDETQCHWMPLPSRWLIATWTLTGHGRCDLEDPTSFLLLSIACYTQNQSLAEYLWATRRDLHDRDAMAANGTLALAFAVARQHHGLVEDLVTRGASTTASLVRFAMIDTDAVDLLRRYGADTSAPSSRVAEQLLFVRAAQLGSMACVAEMIEAGVTVDAPRNHDACVLRAFEYTIKNSDVDGARLLTNAFAVPLSGASMARCFEYATAAQNLELLEILLTHAAATAAIIQEAFKEACFRGLHDVAAVLLASGVDVDLPVCTGTTFLLHQVLSKVGQGDRYGLTAKLLLEAGANVDLVDSFHESPRAIIERRRAHIRTSIGMEQLSFVENELRQYESAASWSNFEKSHRCVPRRSAVNMVW